MKKFVKGFFLPFIIGILICIQTFANKEASAAGTGYWHTSGNKILDGAGNQVKISGVNWFGLETNSFAPHGLWSRNYQEMMDQVKSLGYNTIRLPYSNQILDIANKPNGVDYAKNPQLVNLNGLEVMDRIIDYAGKIGLKIILDRHRPDGNAQSSLWYTDAVPESKWISDWTTLAKRYANNNTIIGADLHNEPHDGACWGCNDPKLDWKAAAERAGNAILEANPDWLIIVEGVQAVDSNWYWWGGNCSAAGKKPINLSMPNKVVYSPHDYPPSVAAQPWFSDANFPNNLKSIWDSNWGYIAKDNIAPVLLGEFGSKLENNTDKIWFDTLVSYLKDTNISWTFWSLNPNSGDTGGLLKDDWVSIQQEKQDKLTTIQGMVIANEIKQSTATAKPTPSTLPLPTTNPQPTAIPTPKITIQPSNISNEAVGYSILDSWDGGFIAQVSITNRSSEAIKNWSLEWTFAGNQVIKEYWSGNFKQTGQSVEVTGNWYNQEISAGQSINIGFKAEYSGINTTPTIIKFNNASAIQPIPYNTPSASIAETIDVWWPISKYPISGTQPFKALIGNKDMKDYELYWQVDNGQLNKLNDSFADYPHKEASVVVSDWNWKGAGPYTVKFVAKDINGKFIGEKDIEITIAR